MKPLTVPVLHLTLSFLFSFCLPSICNAHIYGIANGATLSLPEMIADLENVRLVFVGESHDHPGHHRAQLQIIRALKQKGVAVAVGLEMFRSDSQPALDRWTAGDMPLHEFMAVFNDNWSDWEQYKEIFHYTLLEKIPLIGLNLQRNIVRQVAREGFASLSAGQLKMLPRIIACNVDPAYENFIRRALGRHVNNEVPFQYFCEAQLLWDKVMADNLLRFLGENPGYNVVVLAGSGHAWKHGIPAQIREQSDYTFRVVLPETEDSTEKQTLTRADADYLLLGVDQAPIH